MLSEPKYAAAVGAIIGLIVKYIENRSVKDDESKSGFFGYIKSAAYSAALAAFIAFLVNRASMSSRHFSPISRPRSAAASVYRGGGMSGGGAAMSGGAANGYMYGGGGGGGSNYY